MKKLWMACVALAVSAGMVSAGPIYSFSAVTANSVADTIAGAAQLKVQVNEVGGNPNQVDFLFTNTGPAAMSIADVYFDDGSLLGIAQIFNGAGVQFSQSGSPPNLPGGNAVNFNTTSGFLADSDPPVQPNGVNPGEMLTIRFDLQNGQTFDDTIAALALGLANPGVDVDGGLRIGIHVQGFEGGGSESFVNGPPGSPPPPPPNVVPVPAGVVMALTGLPLLGIMGLRKRRQVATA